MQIQKLREHHFNNNDIYILETRQNYLLTNDNYEGLFQLSFSLDIEKEINIPKGTTIYCVYKEFDGNNLALHCPDQEQIILVNLDSNKNNVTVIPQNDNVIFSPIYYWKNKSLIITTYNHIYYQTCFITHTFKKILVNEIKEKYPDFFSFCNKSKSYNILTSYSEKFSFIAQENDTIIAFHNTLDNTYDSIQMLEGGWHDVEYNNNIFIFVYEKKLKIVHYNKCITLRPDPGYIFLRVKFITQAGIVVLSSKPSNHNDSMLQVYQLIQKSL